MSSDHIRVAISQQEPVWLDLQGAVDKTCKIIAEAASGGAKLVVFPECWIPGYPCWIWVRSLDMNMTAKYMKNALKVDSPEMQKICACAEQNNIAVALGFAENKNNSLYMAQAIISPDGELKVARRKLKPSHLERIMFGDAGGSSLHNVAEMDLSDIKDNSQRMKAKVGALNCWEHTQPLLKYHTHLQGENIHLAAWPPLAPFPGGDAHWAMGYDGVENLSRTYAIEGATFVLHCSTVLTKKGIDAMQIGESPLFARPGGGYSAAYGPDGRRLTDPLPDDEEGLIYADLDMDAVLKAKHWQDSCGHYSRPDQLWLGVDDREKKHKVVVTDGGQTAKA